MNQSCSASDLEPAAAFASEDQSSFVFMKDLKPPQRLLRIAVLGGSGLVGITLLQVLKERNFPVGELHLFASGNSEGKWLETSFGILPLETLRAGQLPPVDIVFNAAGVEVAKRWGWSFAEKGAFVIDKSSYFRQRRYAPLVVPEVNAQTLTAETRIIACPNCTTIPVANVLTPLHRKFELRRVVAVSFQAVSGAGRDAMSDFERERNDPDALPDVFPHRIADNVIPWIGSRQGARCEEETKLIAELRKILALPRLSIQATCARVPVTVGHCVAVHADFRRSITAERARKALENYPGVTVIDDPAQELYPMPLNVRGTDEAWVGRIRRDRGRSGLAFWVAADNLRKGAATNAVRIAESLLEKGFIE